MIKDYCNQKATWKHVIDSNEYDETVYADPVSIDCLKEEKIRLVRNKQGVEVVSDTKITTPSPVEVDDLLDERTAISVLTIRDLDGNVDGYEVML